MLRRRERLLPAAAFLALVATGVLVLVLVTNAVDSGRQALEEAAVAEVQATARSQDASLGGQIAGLAGYLDNLELDLEVGSESDAEQFAEVISLLDELEVRTGFFLTDADGTITQGVRIDPERIGSDFDRPGFDQALQLLAAQPRVPGTYLSVGPGLTTELPTIAQVQAIRGAGEELRGAFVFETEVSVDSGLNEGISELGRGETGEIYLYDSSGGVIASSDPSRVGGRVPSEAFLTPEPGLHRRDGQIQIFADLLGGQWHLASTQDADEFEEGLAGPLQTVGLIVVVVFVAIGIASFIGLSRRLRAAHDEEQRLRRLNETQEEFISIVSHELRTPVAGVLGFLQTTMDHWDSMTDTERFNAVRRSASNARRLQGLTRDVLDSQAVESGRMSYALAEADLREEVLVAVEAATATYPRLRVEAVTEVDLAPVTIDVDRIQQVLTNLIDNAAKVSPPDGTITVRLWCEGDQAHVSVTDDGPGLAPDLRARVFDKFVRGRESGVTGTGLGLYITHQIVTAHGGDIRADGDAGRGATFTFDLPLAGTPALG